jgi:hypothetical protein
MAFADDKLGNQPPSPCSTDSRARKAIYNANGKIRGSIGALLVLRRLG